MCRATPNQTHCKVTGCKNPIHVEKTSYQGVIHHPFCSMVHAIVGHEKPYRATAEHYRLAKDPTYVPPAPRGLSKRATARDAYPSPVSMTPSVPALMSPTLSQESSDDESVATIGDDYLGNLYARMKKEEQMSL